MSDSIDAELLDYYQRELTWLRHAGAGFAARYPKAARRLELGPGECGDPHVERLLEGFALLAARLQRRLDDDYAQFSDALLEQLYPLALRPLPSCAVVRFEPDPAKGKLSAGFHLPRGTPLFVSVPGQERIELPEELRGQTLHWRTTAEVTLWPLRIEEVVLLGAEEAQAATGSAGVRGALRLDLRCLDKDGWAGLDIESLRIHLTANAVAKAALYDLLGAHACGLIAEAQGSEPQRLAGLPQRVGFAAEQALLPEDERVHPGLRLLAEYFAFPDKFAFFDLPLQGLRASGEQLYLYILFDRPAPARLTLQASDLALGCVPAINLFPRTSEPLRPDGTRSEYRLIADAHRENSVEIHSIRSLRASTPLGVVEVAPYHGTQHRPGAFGLYWQARRVEGMTPNRRGSDLLLTPVDAGLQPLEETPQYSLSAELLCTNRSLAEYPPAGTELAFERPGPVARASLLRAPSRQCQPGLDGPSRWQLVSQLTLNHLSLVEGPQALDALREILSLHDFSEDKLAARQIEGLVRLDCTRVVDHVGSDAWRGWRNGLEVRVHLERQAYVGASAVLFGAVLAQFFSLYANANRFVRTVLVQSDQEICRWQPQAGQPITLWSRRLRAEPHRFEWLQALLLLEHEQPQATPLGHGSRPDAEALRLRGPLTPVFAPSQIDAPEDEDDRPLLSTSIFGLGGADGAPPYAYQEWLQQRARQKDHAPAEFLDLFQHRLLSLLYRVLRKHRLAVGFQNPAASPLRRPLRAPVGLLPAGLHERGALPDAGVLARSAHFSGNRRSLVGFAAMLREQFGIPAECEAYAGAWREIPPARRSVLQRGGANLGLGRDAIAGTRVWDEHAGFHLRLGPLDEATARHFFPDGIAYPLLAHLCALYFGPDLDCRLRLLVRASGPLAPGHGNGPRLNWNTGLRSGGAIQPIDLTLRHAEMP